MDLSQHIGLIIGKITANLQLKNLDPFIKFKSFTSAGVALSCCSTLGLKGAVSLSKGVETAEKMGNFFSSSTSLYQTWSVQNPYLVITIHPTS